MSIVLPPNWCADGSDSQRHHYMRCLEVKLINGIPCQCIKRVRASPNDVPHSHQFELLRRGSPCGSQALFGSLSSARLTNDFLQFYAKMLPLRASQWQHPL